jgi:hypothetical protein
MDVLTLQNKTDKYLQDLTTTGTPLPKEPSGEPTALLCRS